MWTLCQYIMKRTRDLLSGICCRAASSVDSITDYNGFYCILSRRAPLASGVDTVRATQIHVNTEFCSSPRLFVSEMTHTCETVKMHVSAGIPVNTVAYVKVNNWERKWMCNSILVHSSLMFLRLSVLWKLIKQQKNHFCSFNTDLLDLIYTVKTMQCYFIFD